MKKQHKIPISIGTSAYNEEYNIKHMLESVCRQKGPSFKIKEILVISDGSTDATVKKVQSIKNRKIKLINDNQRKGQPQRIAELLKKFNGQYLVLLDADLIMNSKDVIEKLIAKFASDKQLGLVAAHLHPLPPKTFLEAAINNYRYGREYLEREYSFNNSVYGAHGCLVYSQKFGKSLKIPPDVMSVDTFSYFSCITRGYKFAHVKDAVVLYRSPQTIKDHINQAKRHYTGGLQVKKYFGADLVDRKFRVPKLIMLKIMLFQVLRNPLGYIFLKILNTYCAYKSHAMLNRLNIAWEPISSSKIILS